LKQHIELQLNFGANLERVSGIQEEHVDTIFVVIRCQLRKNLKKRLEVYGFEIRLREGTCNVSHARSQRVTLPDTRDVIEYESSTITTCRMNKYTGFASVRAIVSPYCVAILERVAENIHGLCVTAYSGE
jgi:hypothetical protein